MCICISTRFLHHRFHHVIRLCFREYIARNCQTECSITPLCSTLPAEPHLEGEVPTQEAEVLQQSPHCESVTTHTTVLRLFCSCVYLCTRNLEISLRPYQINLMFHGLLQSAKIVNLNKKQPLPARSMTCARYMYATRYPHRCVRATCVLT